MKGTIMKLIAVLAVLMLLGCSAALAETKIAVTGTGETRIAADTAVISLGVSARDKDVLKAQQKVNETIAAIRKALIEKGIPEENINTDFINIYAIYDYREETEMLTAYNASSTLAIKVEDIEKAGMVIDEAFAAGANTLNGISFSAENTEEAQAESLKKAVENAKAKAEVLAEAAGMKITGMEIISEGGVFSYGNDVSNFSAKAMGMRQSAAMDSGSTVVQAAKLVVNATVSVTFTAE